jgi:predicted DNA binding CopG/RHH family protein
MQYSNEELELLDAIEKDNIESVKFNNSEIKQRADETLKYIKQKKQISINMKQSDLDFIKQRANDIGISYQNIIQALVHNYATGKLKLSI